MKEVWIERKNTKERVSELMMMRKVLPVRVFNLRWRLLMILSLEGDGTRINLIEVKYGKLGR